MKRFKLSLVAAIAVAALPYGVNAAAAEPTQATAPAFDVSNEALLRSLPGFASGYADVNGIRLHYVEGGKGPLLILLAGWPETWWAYNKVMPDLSRQYHVVSVDLRGMGASSKPQGGYDKKNMAKDIRELVQHLGESKAYVVGHDIGAQVAFAYAANYPEATIKLVMLDVPHPDKGLLSWPMLPAHGTFGDKIDPRYPYVWWFAFHQVKGLPEDLLEGRPQIEHQWFFRYLLFDESAISARDRAVYAAAYSSRDAIRAGNAWYQAFTQDIIDDGTYSKLQMPVLGLGGPGYEWLKATLEAKATNVRVLPVPGSGHFIAEEKPVEMTRMLLAFLKE